MTHFTLRGKKATVHVRLELGRDTTLDVPITELAAVDLTNPRMPVLHIALGAPLREALTYAIRDAQYLDPRL